MAQNASAQLNPQKIEVKPNPKFTVIKRLLSEQANETSEKSKDALFLISLNSDDKNLKRTNLGLSITNIFQDKNKSEFENALSDSYSGDKIVEVETKDRFLLYSFLQTMINLLKDNKLKLSIDTFFLN